MELDTLVERLRAGDSRALARALSFVENRRPESRDILERVFVARRTALIVGLTGPPGVGKSTLADAIAKEAREAGRKVAVLAIDPSSPFTGGALLGDRARMEAGASDPSIFIRSMATRGHVGGLAGAAFEALVLLEAAGKDFILLETVGAGQDEVEVAAAVDVTLVVLAPGLGDEIQAAKAGMLEVADIFAVNKSDRDGAALLVDELTAFGRERPVISTVATRGDGVRALFEALSGLESERSELSRRRLMEIWLSSLLERLLRERLPEASWNEALDSLASRARTPYQAAEKLLEEFRS